MSSPGKPTLRGTCHPRWFTVFAAVAVVGAIASAFAGYDALSRAAPDTKTGWSALGAAGAAVIAVIVVSTLVKRAIIIDADGIEEKRRGRSVRIRWSEPHDLYYRAFDGSGTPTVETATLTTADGRRIEVEQMNLQGDTSTKVPKLVEQYSSTALLPRVHARLNDGDSVPFGAVTLSRDELTVGTVSCSMDGPVTLQVEQGEIKVGAKGSWQASHVSVRDVANYAVLLRAIGQVTHARAPL
jgi:hypothetical protein